MPNNVLKSFSKKSGVSLDKLEKYWDEAKKQAIKKFPKKDDEQIYRYVTAIVKKRAGIHENLCESVNEAINSDSINSDSINLDGVDYSIDYKKAVNALIDMFIDNPDMGDEDDFASDKVRRKKLVKQYKEASNDDIKNDIILWVGEEDLSIDQLLKDKVIK